MDWDIIPEVFYDIIARIIPGSVLVIAACMVYFGPSQVLETLLTNSDLVDARLTLAFLLLAYLVAVIVGPIWEVAGDLKRWKERMEEKREAEEQETAGSTSVEAENAKDASLDPDRILFRTLKHLPKAAAKLSKFQAEVKLCEVLIVGFGVLGPVNLGLCVFGDSLYRVERVFLLAAMAISTFSCCAWRSHLRKQHDEDQRILHSILEEEKADAKAKAPRWWEIWK
jgi:hypothetical protein